jgi:curved DNA-binding protein CbpA
METDYYSLLKVRRDATATEISQAYDAAILRLPKTHLGRLFRFLFSNETEEALELAHTTLVDSLARRTYDKKLGASQSYGIPPA